MEKAYWVDFEIKSSPVLAETGRAVEVIEWHATSWMEAHACGIFRVRSLNVDHCKDAGVNAFWSAE